MAEEWEVYKEQMKNKKMGYLKRQNKKTSTAKCSRILENETVVIQRLSAEVSGKAQKYTCVGAREFVSFEFSEVTIENLKLACSKHFQETELVCDVLAGERGPSCTSIKQLPDLKVIHVRFIEPPPTATNDTGKYEAYKQKLDRGRDEINPSGLPESKKHRSSPAKCSDTGTKPPPSKCIPQSLSIVDMLKLGREINDTTTTAVEVFAFDLEKMAWGCPSTIEFCIEREPFGSGGFRDAYKATSLARGFANKTWVVKKYKEKSIEGIENTKQTVEQHTKKVVQMHCLARNIAAKLHKELEDADSLAIFGNALAYNKIYFGKVIKTEDCITVEEFISGSFDKYVNNNGEVCGGRNTDCEICKKSECLVHYSYERSNIELMVVDIRGCGYMLCDSEIASKTIISDDPVDREYLFTTGNLSVQAMDNFIESHSCNMYCSFLGLQPVNAEK